MIFFKDYEKKGSESPLSCNLVEILLWMIQSNHFFFLDLMTF